MASAVAAHLKGAGLAFRAAIQGPDGGFEFGAAVIATPEGNA